MRNKMWKYYTLKLAFLLLGRFSLRTLYGIAHFFGDRAYQFRRHARRDVIANMRQVMGPQAPEAEVRRAAREVFRNASRYYADLLYIPRMDVQRFWNEQLDIEGVHYLAEARDSGRGGIVVSGHFGSPELVVQAMAAKGFKIFSLTEPLQPQALSDYTTWLRSRHGHEYMPVGYRGIREAILRLKQGGLVALLLDRDIGGNGVPMEFCGAITTIPLGAVEIALRTGADLIPAWAWRIEDFRFRCVIGPPMELARTGDFDEDVRANAKLLLGQFEVKLKSDPGQWAVLEAIWDGKPKKPAKEREPAGTLQ
jgi:KDO2-lipid IV(A) lauroyltransferase